MTGAYYAWLKIIDARHGRWLACKASEVVDAHFVMQLEHAAQALHPPPEAVLLVRLHSQPCSVSSSPKGSFYLQMVNTMEC